MNIPQAIRDRYASIAAAVETHRYLNCACQRCLRELEREQGSNAKPD